MSMPPALEATQAPAGLFESLSKALEAPKAEAAALAAAKPRAPEAVTLPAFADLEAYWTHLQAQPGLAAGDASASVTRVVRGAGPAGAPLAIVGLEPGEADAAAGLAFQGEPGALLAKMLKAIRLDAEACYRTNLVKAIRQTRPGQRELSRLGQWLHLELSLVRAPVVLLLGEACARAVLKVGKPIAELRQEPVFIDGREFVVTYHPTELLQREELKRKAWEDLQWLQKRMSEGRI
jgi:DNA polymerase